MPRKHLQAAGAAKFAAVYAIEESYIERVSVWGKQPLLLRGAFLKDAQTKDSAFPSWRDIIDLACTGNDDEDYLDDEPTIPSRLIAITRPGQIDSFELLGFGPFESRRYLDRQLASGKDTASTLVVNDVDRWIPDLSQWMDDNFASLIPRWRRDDAQISLANQGGGIGPHVDSYDVFLIQLSGTRTWELGVNYRVSVKEEFENLIEACSENGVRILNMTNVLSKESATAGQTRTTVKIQVEPGDCLYLPPRVAHWGTATSEKCMTLSVGCRAPSAADLIARLSETIILDAATASSLERVHQRYTEKDVGSMDSLPSSSFLSPDVKKTMKDLILEAVNQVLDDEDAVLDPLIGKIVTEPNRFAGDLSSYPVPLYDLDKASKTELGLWGNAESALEEVLVNGRGSFKRAEGVAFAWSYIEREGSYRTYRMYAHGRDAVEFVVSIAGEEHENAVGQLMDRIANGLPLNRSFLESIGMDSAANELHSFLLELINEGLLYGTDEPSSDVLFQESMKRVVL
ncbi:cupin 4 family protein [Nitzschia inconspicua]|uniref:Bifunctional lysine-specific demethylase and histidyl-hydroxylase n=1 Tax=Nitzschia inconspicua TaxID=303405 RepID=A0A9K3PQ17_9STRA|nr:cupin 4 family protein [Nitzschia inconspicua]